MDGIKKGIIVKIMKSLKFTPDLAKLILSGKKTSTWRFFDDKDLQKGDLLTFINKESGEEFTKAVITDVWEKEFDAVNETDLDGHESFKSKEDMFKTYKRYYGLKVTPKSILKVIRFKLLK